MPDNSQEWLNGRPILDGETCVISEPQYWKRDALLFDRIYVRSQATYTRDVPPIPVEIGFASTVVEKQIDEHESWWVRGAQSAGVPMLEEWAESALEGDMKRGIAERYGKMGVIATPAYATFGDFIKEFPAGTKIAYLGALQNLPVVSSLTWVGWDQILEFRNDPEAKRKYRDLRLWLQKGLNADSVAHASDIIGKMIDDYSWALKKHGFRTAIGGISHVLDWKRTAPTVAASGAAAILGGPIWAALTSGLLLTSQIASWVAEQLIDFEDAKRGPNSEIAILYEAKKKFG